VAAEGKEIWMVDPRCVDYIRTHKDKYPMDALKAALLKAGASPSDVEEAARLAVAPPMRRSSAPFAEIFPTAAASGDAAPAQGPAPARPADISGPSLLAQARGLLPRARSVVLDPAGFFRTMPRRGGWREPLFFLDRKKATIGVSILGGAVLLWLLGSTLNAWKQRLMTAHPEASAPQSLMEASRGAAQSQQGQTPGAPGSGQPPASAQAMQALSSALGALGADANIKAVAPDALKELLPRELPDLRRAGAESALQRLGQLEMAAATGAYEAAAGGKVDIQLIDAGSYSGLLSIARNFAGAAPGQSPVAYKACPGVEQYDRQSRSGSLQIIVAQRFAVKVTGSGVDMKVVRAALDAVDLDALGRLAR